MSSAKQDHPKHPSTVGINLKRLRKLAGFTQEGLADAADVARVSVGYWESGERHNPDLDSLRKLAVALECDVGDLIEPVLAGDSIEPHIKAFEASKEARDLKPADEELAWLRTLPPRVWKGIKPTPVAIQFMLLARRSSG